jgi:hypothetical protein
LVISALKPEQTAEASGATSTLETLGSSVGTAVVGTILVVSLTAGVGKLVSGSTVFSDQAKTKISNSLSSSIEVVNTSTISDKITENGAYEAETVRIYDQARQNAFIITLLFMAAIAALSYKLSAGLPAKKVAEAEV